MNLDEARRIVASCDDSDPKKALDAIAMVLRHRGIADARLLKIATDLEAVAKELK